MNHTTKIAIMASGQGSIARSIISAIQERQLPCEVKAIICNKPQAPVMAFAESQHCAIAVDDQQDQYHQRLHQILLDLDVDYVLLCGYMKMITATTVNTFYPNIINIHPSLLPLYPGLHTHQQALDHGDQFHGSTVHVINEHMDEGPIIAQVRLPIEADDTPSSLQSRLKPLEQELMIRVLTLLCEQAIELSPTPRWVIDKEAQARYREGIDLSFLD